MDQLAKESSRAILIEGYTDNIGLFKNNQALSQRRAEVIAGVLVDYGIDASRISCKGLGEEYPVFSNLSEAGRLQNRRVRIVLAG
jgi:outer membrane protein OmpA-like peptidoglycan-associated protein